MLIPLWTLSQNIDLTPEQKARVEYIFTPQKIIDVSKGLDNEKRQAIHIKELEQKIDSLKAISLRKSDLINKFITEISNLNKIITDLNREEDEVSDDQLDDARKPFLGLHLKAGIVVQQFQLQQFNGFIDLTYDFDKVSIGVKGWTNSVSLPDNTITTNLYYGPFVTYKFF